MGSGHVRSAALSQKAALQMPFAVTTPPVKMRLERSAERDKREIKIILPLNMARAQRKPFQIVPPSCIYHIFIDNKPHFAVN